MSKSIRILLVSPTRNLDPYCGDVTITELLSRFESENVVFTTYEDALLQGTLRNIVSDPSSLCEFIISLIVRLINKCRRFGLLFVEDFRIYSVDSDKFDLVHVFVFPFRLQFSGKPLPVVFSQAISSKRLYLDARQWVPQRFMLLSAVESFLVKAFGIFNPNLLSATVDLYLGFTNYHCAEVSKINSRLSVLKWHPFVNSAGVPALVKSEWNETLHIGFIAKDFFAKGGQTVLQISEELTRQKVKHEISIYGCYQVSTQDNVRFYGLVERHELITKIMPTFDMLVYPTNFDGWPLVVAEVQMIGVPVVVSDYCGVPEMVPGPLFVVKDNNPNEWCRVIRSMTDCRYDEVRQIVKSHAESSFSSRRVMTDLLAHYRNLLV